MDVSGIEGLLGFYDNIDGFLLILVRIVGFFVILPVFSGSYIPMRVKIGFAFLMSVVLSVGGSVPTPQYDPNVFGFAAVAVTEFLVGFLMAYAAYMVFSIFYFVGQLVDYQIGYSMVSVFDPISQIQVPITGNLFYLLIAVLFVISGLDYYVHMLAYSFTSLPPGQAFVLGNSTVMGYIVDMIVSYLELGVRFSFPVVGAILVIDVALGLLTRAAPQMNVFVIGIPIKLFVGLIVVFMMIPAFGFIYETVFTVMSDYSTNILKDLMP